MNETRGTFRRHHIRNDAGVRIDADYVSVLASGARIRIEIRHDIETGSIVVRCPEGSLAIEPRTANAVVVRVVV